MTTNNHIPDLFAVVVNDDGIQCQILSGLLSRAGIEAKTFESAESALMAMKGLGAPDLIVTDLYMPGIDGWRFCRLLRSKDYAFLNSVPILVVSATFAGEDVSAITADLGANAFMASPVEGKVFVETARSLMAGEKPVRELDILIVADSSTLSSFLKKNFQEQGYQVTLALNAGSAIEDFSRISFDIALIDYHLPDGKGDSLLKDFQQTRPDCVCIMMTSDPNPELVLAWMGSGAAAYVHKPFDSTYLVELCIRVRRERALLRVEYLLEERTRQLQKSEESKNAVLKRKSDEQRLLLDTIDTQIWYLTDTETYGRLNRAHADFLGRDFKDVAYKKLEEFLSEDVAEAFRAANTKVFETRRPAYTEEWIPDARGEKRLIRVTRIPQIDGNGNVAYVVCSGTDITESKQKEKEQIAMERRIQQMEKAESLTRMAGAVAHNFNNMLTVVIGNLELAREDLPANSDISGNLEDAEDAARRAAEMSRLMLTFLGHDHGMPVSMNLVHICRENLNKFQDDIPENISLASDFYDPGPLVKAVSEQILQLIHTFIINAVEAMEGASGKINLSIHEVKTVHIPEKNRFPFDWEPSSDDWACLEIRDTGCGMDEKTINRIFDPFYTDKFSGRGMGLAVAMGIVKNHGGCITVESRTGLGSTFRLFLPLLS